MTDTSTPLDPAALNYNDLLYRFWYGIEPVISLAEIARREGVSQDAIYSRYYRDYLPYPVIRTNGYELGVREADYIPGTIKNAAHVGVRQVRKV